MSRVFRLFISSTFQDWHPEREHLREYISPRLRKLCESKGARFLPVDLRWGISEEAGKTHDTVDICLEEIERCQRLNTKPNFLVLMGNRYGWRPIPSRLTTKDAKNGKSGQWERLQELGVIRESKECLFHAWYERDDNAVPAEYVLRPIKDENKEERGEWTQDEKKLRELLDQSYFPKDSEVPNPAWMTSFTEDELAFLVGSVVEQEIIRGALSVKGARSHVHTFFRKLEGEIDSEAYTDKGNETEKAIIGYRQFRPKGDDASKSSLESKLRSFSYKKNLHEYTGQYRDQNGNCWGDGYRPEGYLNKFGEDVYRSLSEIIKKELQKSESGEVVEPPETKHFVGFGTKLKKIEAHNSGPLLVFGDPGSGKSTLLSKAVKRLERGHDVLAYWVGRDPRCASGEGLLRAILSDFRNSNGWVTEDFQWEPTETKSFFELSSYLERVLSNLTDEARTKIRIIIDAVDQLPEGGPGKKVDWIPTEIPTILSTLDEGIRKSFCEKFDAEKQLITLEKMSRDDAETLLGYWLDDDFRKLQGDKDNGQKGCVLDAFSGVPLHLRMLYEDAKKWKSSHDANCQNMATSTDEAIASLYSRLSEKHEHGSVMVQRTLGYFVAGRFGLSEDELLRLLRNDEHVVASFRHRSPLSPPVDTLPEIVWSRLYHDLEPFLAKRSMHGEQLLDFYHMQFRRVAETGGERKYADPWLSEPVLQDCRRRFAATMLVEWGGSGGSSRERVYYELIDSLYKVGEQDNFIACELYSLIRNRSFLNGLSNLNITHMLDELQKAVSLSVVRNDLSEACELALIRGHRLDSIRYGSLLDAYNNNDTTLTIALADNFIAVDRTQWLLLIAYLFAKNNKPIFAECILNDLFSKEFQWKNHSIKTNEIVGFLIENKLSVNWNFNGADLELINSVVKLWIKKDQADNAIAVARQFGDESSLVEVAKNYFQTGLTEKAEAILREVNPNLRKKAMFEFIIWQHENNQLSGVSELMVAENIARELDGENIIKIASAFASQGDREHALRLLEESVNSINSNGLFLSLLDSQRFAEISQAYIKVGRPEKAIQIVTTYLMRVNGEASTKLSIIRTMAKFGYYSKAISVLNLIAPHRLNYKVLGLAEISKAARLNGDRGVCYKALNALNQPMFKQYEWDPFLYLQAFGQIASEYYSLSDMAKFDEIISNMKELSKCLDADHLTVNARVEFLVNLSRLLEASPAIRLLEEAEELLPKIKDGKHRLSRLVENRFLELGNHDGFERMTIASLAGLQSRKWRKETDKSIYISILIMYEALGASKSLKLLPYIKSAKLQVRIITYLAQNLFAEGKEQEAFQVLQRINNTLFRKRAKKKIFEYIVNQGVHKAIPLQEKFLREIGLENVSWTLAIGYAKDGNGTLALKHSRNIKHKRNSLLLKLAQLLAEKNKFKACRSSIEEISIEKHRVVAWLKVKPFLLGDQNAILKFPKLYKQVNSVSYANVCEKVSFHNRIDLINDCIKLGLLDSSDFLIAQAQGFHKAEMLLAATYTSSSSMGSYSDQKFEEFWKFWKISGSIKDERFDSMCVHLVGIYIRKGMIKEALDIWGNITGVMSTLNALELFYKSVSIEKLVPFSDRLSDSTKVGLLAALNFIASGENTPLGLHESCEGSNLLKEVKKCLER